MGNVDEECCIAPTIGKILSFEPNFLKKTEASTKDGSSFEEDVEVVIEKFPRLCETDPYVDIEDFEHIKFVGRGAHSVINLAKCHLNDQLYALKTWDKNKIVRHDYINNLMREKDILVKCEHPNIIRLESTFQDKSALYFWLEYHPNGDLATLIRNNGALPLELTRFYTMQLINALEYMQKNDIIHRDMKPENILLDEWHNCWIADFGCAKNIDSEQVEEEIKSYQMEPEDFIDHEEIDHQPDFGTILEKNISYRDDVKNNHTFVGTPLYVSPEMLLHNSAWFGSDLWGLGCILYQLLCGKPPFQGPCQNVIFEKILNVEFRISNKIDPAGRDLVKSLLKLDPYERLGAGIEGSLNDIEVLKSHVFFKGHSFDNLDNWEAPSIDSLDIKPSYENADISMDDLNINRDSVQL